jgi:cytochrome c-type biogenesis protein CcmE
LATFFVLKALDEKIVFFYTPTKLFEKEEDKIQYIRVGGLVKEKSINFSDDGLKVNFMITDNKKNVNVMFEGILPDLFRENQGVVAEGRFNKEKKIFLAEKVLAKHDENYMPPEIHKALEEEK